MEIWSSEASCGLGTWRCRSMEVMRCVLLCMLEAVESTFCLLEVLRVLEVLSVLEVLRVPEAQEVQEVQDMLEVPDAIRCVLLW